MATTLALMPRKKKQQSETESTEAVGTSLIRVDADLAEMLGIIAARKKRQFSIAAFVSPIIRPHVAKLYAELVREMANKLTD